MTCISNRSPRRDPSRPRTTCTKPPPEEVPKTLAGLVSAYRRDMQPNFNDELAWYTDVQSWPEAIERAARCRTANGKRHPHQRRIKESVLDEGRKALLRAAEKTLWPCTSFASLKQQVEQCCKEIPGLGALYAYDVTLRLAQYPGRKVDWEPDRVWLHAGTAAGARALRFSGVRNLMPADLPSELRTLSPKDIEVFLCVYKDDISRLKTNRTP